MLESFTLDGGLSDCPHRTAFISSFSTGLTGFLWVATAKLPAMLCAVIWSGIGGFTQTFFVGASKHKLVIMLWAAVWSGIGVLRMRPLSRHLGAGVLGLL